MDIPSPITGLSQPQIIQKETPAVPLPKPDPPEKEDGEVVRKAATIVSLSNPELRNDMEVLTATQAESAPPPEDDAPAVTLQEAMDFQQKVNRAENVETVMETRSPKEKTDPEDVPPSDVATAPSAKNAYPPVPPQPGSLLSDTV